MSNDINKGELARQIVDNPIYQEAIISTKARLMDEWVNTRWFQRSKREAFWRMYRAVGDVERHIQRVLDTGDMARIDELRRQKLKNVI